MKNLLLSISIIFAALGFLSCIPHQENKDYIISDIDSTESLYFIKAFVKGEFKDSVLIISAKDRRKGCDSTIKVGKTYRLNLENYFSKADINKISPIPHFNVSIEGRLVKMYESHFPYKTENLSGLCFSIR